MNDRSDRPTPAPRNARAPRTQTPRVPSNVFYNRIVPIAIGVMVLLLLIVIVAVVLGAGAGY
jgi:hypothetical protein